MAICWAMLLGLAGCARAQEPGVNDLPAVRAPELEPNLGWLNTDKPLRLNHELKGQVVLLDFWTYCCINCMHILPDLEYLEKKYADQPVMIIGVHSAKFENEAARETIRAAIQRYKIHHPVVIDDDMAIWNRYTAQGWPTFVLIDSRGRVVGMTSGEGHREELDAAIASLLEEGRKAGTLAKAPVKVNANINLMPTGELAFPGKVLADVAGGRLFTADSNHNRIVISTLPDAVGRARLIATVGSGKQGRADGGFDEASFHNPQGLALRGNELFVADTDNHLIRKIDLATSRVTTIAGTGEQGYDRRGGRKGTAQEISSPWDVALQGNRLFIAMAGLHQIWVMDLDSGMVRRFSGTGQENIHDGAADEANFAQPSGLALDGDNLYVADSEVSALRTVNTKSGAASTIVGKGLFVFGDVDGAGGTVRLQHPLGVATSGSMLLVADTYNHKIKTVDPAAHTVKTLAGTGKPGAGEAGGAVAFFEPSGLTVAGERLIIADANNHRLVQLEPASGRWSEVKIDGLKAPAAAAGAVASGPPAVAADAVVVAADATTITLTLGAALPASTHPNAEAPMLVRVTAGDDVIAREALKTDKLPVSVDLPAAGLPTSGTLTVSWSFAYCTEGNSAICIPQRFSWSVPVSRGADGGEAIKLVGEVKGKPL